MFFIRPCVLVLFLTLVLSAGKYTVDDLVLSGYRNSHEIKSIKEDQKKSEAQIEKTRAGAFPVITASANASRAIGEPYSPISTDAGSGMETEPTATQIVQGSDSPYDLALAAYLDSLVSGLSELTDIGLDKNTIEMKVKIQQPLFAQGKVITGLKIAKQHQRSLLCKLHAKKAETKKKITTLFYNSLLASMNIEATREAVDIAEESRRITVESFKTGSGNELDTLRTGLNLEQTRSDLKEAEKGLIVANRSLIQASGVSETPESITLTGEFPEADYEVSLDTAIQKAESQNKQLLQLYATEKMMEYNVKIQKSDFLPRVYCGASIGRTAMFDEVEDIDLEQNSNIFAGVSIDLFKGTSRFRAVQEKKAELESFRETKKNASELVEVGVRKSLEDLKTAKQDLKRFRRMVSMAEKGYRVSKSSYEQGMTTSLEMKDAENSLNKAKIGLNNAKFAYHFSVIELKVLMGEYVEPSEYKY
ncbi:MAG: TolC family protein [Chitinivibrionales bacterium]